MTTSTSALGTMEAWGSGFSTLCFGPSLVSVEDRPKTSAPALALRAAEELDDLALIARIQQGDEEAARHLVERLYPTVLKSIRRHRPRRTMEADLSQAVFAKIFKNLHQFSGKVPLEHWVVRITINTCLDQLQRESAAPELRMADLDEESQAVIEQLATSNEELPDDRSKAARELMAELLERLNPEERLVITMVHLEERSSKEISRLTGWSVPAVKVKAFRARHKMKKLWSSLLDGERF